MAIGYGVPAPKGKTRKQLKSRKDREDAKQLKAFRDSCWERERLKAAAETYSGIPRCQNCRAVVHRGESSLSIWHGEIHHRIGRRAKASRYDPDNGVLLCAGPGTKDCHGQAHRKAIQV